MKVTISKGPARCGKLDDRHHSGRKWLVAGRRLPRRVWASATGVIAALLVSSGGLKAVTVTTLGGSSAGYVNGPTLSTALFHTPIGLALDSSQNLLFVADSANNAIRILNLSAGNTYTFASTGITNPVGVVVDASDHVYVLNRGNGNNGRVVEFDSFGYAIATNAVGLTNATGIALDSLTNIYVTFRSNSIMQISPSGVVNTDFIVISTNKTSLQGITVMFNGYLAVCDSGNNGIYTINPSTLSISNLTGFNGAGTNFGPRAHAQFNAPSGIAAAGGSLLVVADSGNNRVKVVDPAGTVTNLYGVVSSDWSNPYPGWADGAVCPGGDLNYNCIGYAESRLPKGVLFAGDGSVYVTEDYYHLIRKATGNGLPLPPPPPPPVSAPEIGWVLFVKDNADNFLSQLQVASSWVFNNDVTLAILVTDTNGAETHFTFGQTPVGVDNIPDPSPSVGSSPPFPPYENGLFADQVPPSFLPPQPDVTVKAISFASGRRSSAIAQTRFQFKAADPLLVGDNAASFTISNSTIGATMWYTLDGSDPTNRAPSIGPITSGALLSLNASATNLVFRIRAFRDNYQPSSIATKVFFTNSFVPNNISFGFDSGEASSDFIASPGQFFYAPVTLSLVTGTKMYSLQFNLTVTNTGPNPGPPVAPNAYDFQSFLEKPIPGSSPPVYERIPPLMFSAYALNPPPPNQIITYDGLPFVNLMVTNTTINLLGVGWLERFTQKNLYDTTKQDLIKYSQPHDTLFDESNLKVVVGGYAFQVPLAAAPGNTYKIRIGLPSATSDGVGAPGSDVFIGTPTNGSLTAGAINSIKIVTAGQRKYIAGDAYPFRWFNAGDFGDTNLDNPDVMQVFQSAIYSYNFPPPGSDFFDSMDSCGYGYTVSPNGYLVIDTNTAYSGLSANTIFDGNDTNINQIAFGDGVLDVCDVYVTFRRSLDPCYLYGSPSNGLYWFRRFWTNGVLGAEKVCDPSGAPVSAAAVRSPLRASFTTNYPSVNFGSTDFRASAGQTLQIPITASIFGQYPLRVLMLNLSVVPLDGSPALTNAIQFTPNVALGQPTVGSSDGNGNYAATWLNSSIGGLAGNATIGTLTVQVPANATASSAYAIHFDHASASPNGIASFRKQTTTGLITLSDRSGSFYGDGIPDSWRLRYFGTVYNLLSQAKADADGDGANNWQEYVAGTDPTDPSSVLKASSDQAAATQKQDCVVHWPSVAGKTYVIQRSATIFSPGWIPVSTNIGTGSDMEYHDTNGGSVRFYRVQVQ
jgi:hypothetical protein